jgi:FKBP-type peptidyl-prolyl cis-trans isomerase
MLAEDCSTKSYATDATRCPRTRRAQVIVAIRAVQDHKGASRQAIVKYLKSEFQCENGVAIKKALKSDKLIQTGQSFRVKGDAPIAPPADEVVGTEDVTVGDGAVAQKGDEVAMSYVGTLEDGSRFDAGKDFRFTLGAGDVIKGWDKGIVGMRVGGRRKLVVPSKLGYGKKGSAPEIPPNATLLFDVTLERIL